MRVTSFSMIVCKAELLDQNQQFGLWCHLCVCTLGGVSPSLPSSSLSCILSCSLAVSPCLCLSPLPLLFHRPSLLVVVSMVMQFTVTWSVEGIVHWFLCVCPMKIFSQRPWKSHSLPHIETNRVSHSVWWLMRYLSIKTYSLSHPERECLHLALLWIYLWCFML